MIHLRNRLKATLRSPYLRIVVFQVVEVGLGFQEELHNRRGVRHELDKDAFSGKLNSLAAISIENATEGPVVPCPCLRPGRSD